MMVSQESLLGVLDALQVGIAVVDAQDTIIVMNRRFGEMVQIDPAERTGTSIHLCHPPEAQAGVERLLQELRTGVKTRAEAWVNFRGRIIYEYLYPIYDAQGQFVGVADELHDAAQNAEYEKLRGTWRDLPVSGEGGRGPRPVHHTI